MESFHARYAPYAQILRNTEMTSAKPAIRIRRCGRRNMSHRTVATMASDSAMENGIIKEVGK